MDGMMPMRRQRRQWACLKKRLTTGAQFDNKTLCMIFERIRMRQSQRLATMREEITSRDFRDEWHRCFGVAERMETDNGLVERRMKRRKTRDRKVSQCEGVSSPDQELLAELLVLPTIRNNVLAPFHTIILHQMSKSC